MTEIKIANYNVNAQLETEWATLPIKKCASIMIGGSVIKNDLEEAGNDTASVEPKAWVDKS